MSYYDDIEPDEDERDNRITELEVALTDALYAWGLVSGDNRPELRDYKEAEERIQKARAVLRKDIDSD